MSGFENYAEQLARVENALSPVTLALADSLRAPLTGSTRRALPEQLQALDPHRVPLRQIIRRFNQGARQSRGRDTRAQARIRSEMKAAAFRLKHWDRITAHVAALTDLMPVPLDPSPAPLPPGEAQRRAVMEDVHRLMHLQANPNAQDDDAAAHGAFPDIALKAYPFLDLVQAGLRVALAQRRAAPLRFLDVGCGGGTNVMMAARYFDEAVGLEYDAGYAAAAQKLLGMAGATRCRAIEGDALTFEVYADFDVIYFYRPLSDLPKMIELEARIATQARPGTILLAPYDGLMQRYLSHGLTRIGHWIYLTGTATEAGKALQAEAELIGLETRKPGTLLHRRLGFWAPVVAACYDIGHGLEF